MEDIKKEIKNAKEYIESLKEEYNNIDPNEQWKLKVIAINIDEYEYYVMGLEFGLKEIEKVNKEMK